MDVLRDRPHRIDFSLSLFCCCGLQLRREKQKTQRGEERRVEEEEEGSVELKEE